MRLLFITYSFVLVVVATCLAYLKLESETVYNIMLGSYVIQLLFFITTIKKNNKGKMQYLRPFFILLLGMTIVNFQVIIDTLFGSFNTELTIWQFQDYIGQCLYLGIIAQTSLTMGYVCNKYNFVILRKGGSRLSTFNVPRHLWGGILLVLFVIFILTIDVQAFLRGDSTVNDGSFDREIGTSALYSELILNVFFVIIISVTTITFSKEEDDKSIKKYLSSFPIVFWIVFVAYLILRLFSGDRGPVMYNLATLLFAYVYATKRVYSITSLAIFLIIGAFGITIIGIARKKTSELTYEAKIAYAIEEFKKSDAQSFIPVTQELAGSVKVTAIAIRGIERGSIEQGYGRYNIMEWTNAVPFSSKLMYALFPSLKDKSFIATEILTVDGYGKYYSSGLGNTSIADVYLDFGTFGIPILFFFFGFIYRKIDDVIVVRRNVSPYLLTFTLFMSSHAIYIGRSSFSFIMAKACLFVLILYVLNIFLKFIDVKR